MARDTVLGQRGGARPSTGSRDLTKVASGVGGLTKDLPNYVRNPPIEAVVFGWGVAEDGQLVCHGFVLFLVPFLPWLFFIKLQTCTH
jgi:hypothetical protein